MIKLGTTVLDTDSIIRTSITLDGEKESLLEIFLKLEGEYYIHSHIKSEVKWPEQSKQLLDILVDKKLVKVLSDKDLLELLKEKYTMPYRTFLSNLKVCCSIFNTKYYSLKALSVLGIFYILKDTLNEEKASAYINKLPHITFKIYDSKGNMIKKSGEEIIKLIYSGKLVLYKDGNIKLVD